MTSPPDPVPDADPQPLAFAPARDGRAQTPHLESPRIWWLVGWALVLFILYSTLAPSADVPNLHIWDKLEHAGAFFGLTLWFGGLVRRSRYALLAFWLLLFGGAIELLQGYLGWGRDMDIHDFLADSIGIAVAFALLFAGLSQWAVTVERILGLARERS